MKTAEENNHAALKVVGGAVGLSGLALLIGGRNVRKLLYEKPKAIFDRRRAKALMKAQDDILRRTNRLSINKSQQINNEPNVKKMIQLGLVGAGASSILDND